MTFGERVNLAVIVVAAIVAWIIFIEAGSGNERGIRVRVVRNGSDHAPHGVSAASTGRWSDGNRPLQLSGRMPCAETVTGVETST